MMSCREVSELVSRSLDEDLPLLTRVKVRLHLMMCRMCAAFARRVRILRAQLHAASADDAAATASLPPASKERMKAVLRNEIR